MDRTRTRGITHRGALLSLAAACLLGGAPMVGPLCLAAAPTQAPPLYLPRSLRKLQPSALVVVLLPTGTQDGSARLRASGWTTLADAEGFAVVPVIEGPTPDATRERIVLAFGVAKQAMRLDFGRLFLATEAASGLPPSGAGDYGFVAVALDAPTGDLPALNTRTATKSPAVCLLYSGTVIPAAVRDSFRRTASAAGFTAEGATTGQKGRTTAMTRISPENGREVSLCAVNGQTPAEVAWRFFEEHATGPARITVTVTGLRGGDRGTVAASLYAGPEGFPDDAEKALAQKESPVADGRAVLTFEDVPAPGAFAVVILHDENGNGKMDTAFGLPSEGYGASNNPKARFGPPRYNDARFTIRGRGAVHAVAVKALYLTGGGG